ncbi:AP-4 complex subunit mu [Forsythia ovata]|uniref:AP-4 complex subunit mu n=1 Tax=Forsythia ovata TaxID=205694 RepID=A0ABD1VL38_9LAMI
MELLQRVAHVIKDYLDNTFFSCQDFGYAQSTSTEVLKPYIFNEPIVGDAGRLPSLGPAALFMQGNKAVTKSVVAHETEGTKREEIFVDVIEKISVTFSSSAAKEIGSLQAAKSKLEKEVEELTRQCNWRNV